MKNGFAPIRVKLPDSGRTLVIDAYGPQVRYGEQEKHGTVNWSGIGEVSPDDAIAYAEAIIVAAQAAKRLEKRTAKLLADATGRALMANVEASIEASLEASIEAEGVVADLTGE
jgi:hypothetical protein